MKVRKPFVFALSFLVVAIVFYFLGFLAADTQQQTPSEVATQDDIQSIPECDLNGCPEYEAIDTDGDGQYESVVYKRIAMTKGAAEVLIIDNGKIVFSSGGAQFSYNTNEDIPGITVNYVKEFDETGLRPKTWAEDKYLYLDGKYILYDDHEGFCEENINLEADNNSPLTSEPKYPDYSIEKEASTFKTAINKTIDSGVNYAGHYTIATWGCGTDCFGYAVVDLIDGNIVAFRSSNEDYNIGGLEIKGRYMILNPVKSGETKKYYRINERRNYSNEIDSVFSLVCTETSTKNAYGLPSELENK